MIPASFIEKRWREARPAWNSATLEFIAPNGEVMTVKGRQPGPRAHFRIHDWDVLRRIMARGDIGLGEEYIAGSWETDDVEALVSLFLLNMDASRRFLRRQFPQPAWLCDPQCAGAAQFDRGSARNIKDITTSATISIRCGSTRA